MKNRKQSFLHTAAIGSAILLTFISEQAIANESVSIPLSSKSSTTCKGSINSVKAELVQKGFFSPWKATGWAKHLGTIQPKVVINNSRIRAGYFNYPRNRPQSVRFLLPGDLTKLSNLLSSPRLMTSLTARIISACDRVGLVEYASWWEPRQIVGYFPDNTVRPFTISDSHDRPVKKPGRKTYYIQEWGYYFSP